MVGIGAYKQRMVDPSQALPGRATPMPVRNAHHVHGRPIAGPHLTGTPDGPLTVQFGMGCFWGAERKFWSIPGVETTRSAMPAATRRTRPIAKSAPAKPGMPKWCWSRTTRRSWRSMRC